MSQKDPTVNLDAMRGAVLQILGEEPREMAWLESGNNDVVRVEVGDESYVLKCFERKRYGPYEREMGMRACLRRFSRIAFPRVVGCVERGGTRYVLMEHVDGERLEEIWRRDGRRAREEMGALGRMLGALHEIPARRASGFLEREDLLFSEAYFAWMVETITPYLRADDADRLLRTCYEAVTQTTVEEVVIHGDFGPHQVMVDAQGEWVLVDFEYAALGAFADDLGGAEVRLERATYGNVEGFLRGYGSVRGRLAAYEPVRSAYKAYNLLAILTYCLAHRGEKPPREEVDRLEGLLARV